MDDDIDDLLNEVESKFCATVLGNYNTKQATSVNTRQGADMTGTASDANKVRKTKGTGAAALDSLIDDIFDDSAPEKGSSGWPKHTSRPTRTKSSARASGSAKCFSVYLGGSECPRGISTAVHQRTCDSLRCTDCDFNVEIFDDLCWHPETDYLFLRNNIPEFEKLKVNLVNRTGWRAYACQCKSKSVGEQMELQETNFKWVCGKH